MTATPSTVKVFTIGLKKLEAGEIDPSGAMPASGMAQHGNVYRNTLELTTDDPEVEEYYEEENDLPAATEGTLGRTNLVFEILRPSVADLLFWMGGEVDEATGLKWSAPKTYSTKFLALKLESKQGYDIEIPKAQIVASTVGGGQKSTPMRLRVTATVLVPTNSQGEDQAPMHYTAPE
jgi:hypothetical protein